MRKSRRSWLVALRDERGVAAPIVGIMLIALFGMAMLAVDAGSLWSARRNLITGTDAAALHAAQFFNNQLGDPCSPAGVAAAESGATDVMQLNNEETRHSPTDTPVGFDVDVDCSLAGYRPGTVRFDGRLRGAQSFSTLFGFGELDAFSSSTAAWGYITAIGEGLRPIAVCSQTPNYAAFTDLFFGRMTLAAYDSLFGTAAWYPASSDGWANGYASPNDNPNRNKAYTAPGSGSEPDGTNGFHTVHRMTMPNSPCGQGNEDDPNGSRVWVDFEDDDDGAIGRKTLEAWLEEGYKGTVSLTPHDCNPANGNGDPEDCGSAPGTKASLERSLGKISCDRRTMARECEYQFPILVVDQVTDDGSQTNYRHISFLYVVLRGFSELRGNRDFQFDFEFLNLKTTNGIVGNTPPDPNVPYLTGTMLCGVDHDTASDRCPDQIVSSPAPTPSP